MKPPLPRVTLTLALLLAAGPVPAQQVTGVVVDHPAGAPLRNVHVTLLDLEQRQYDGVLTDSLGRFTLSPPAAGSWLVRAEHLGYTTTRSEPVSVSPGERVRIEIRLSTQPISVEPVVVVGRSPEGNADIEAFYDRVRYGRRTGLGTFVTRAEIEKSAALEPSDLLRRVPGVQVVARSGRVGSTSRIRVRGCRPTVYVDGMPINHPGITGSLDELVPLTDIEGIEVYRGVGRTVDGYHDPNGCGLILVWTRRGTSDGPDSSWVRFLIGTALLLSVLFLH